MLRRKEAIDVDGGREDDVEEEGSDVDGGREDDVEEEGSDVDGEGEDDVEGEGSYVDGEGEDDVEGEGSYVDGEGEDDIEGEGSYVDGEGEDDVEEEESYVDGGGKDDVEGEGSDVDGKGEDDVEGERSYVTYKDKEQYLLTWWENKGANQLVMDEDMIKIFFDKKFDFIKKTATRIVKSKTVDFEVLEIINLVYIVLLERFTGEDTVYKFSVNNFKSYFSITVKNLTIDQLRKRSLILKTFSPYGANDYVDSHTRDYVFNAEYYLDLIINKDKTLNLALVQGYFMLLENIRELSSVQDVVEFMNKPRITVFDKLPQDIIDTLLLLQKGNCEDDEFWLNFLHTSIEEHIIEFIKFVGDNLDHIYIDIVVKDLLSIKPKSLDKFHNVIKEYILEGPKKSKRHETRRTARGAFKNSMPLLRTTVLSDDFGRFPNFTYKKILQFSRAEFTDAILKRYPTRNSWNDVSFPQNISIEILDKQGKICKFGLLSIAKKFNIFYSTISSKAVSQIADIVYGLT